MADPKLPGIYAIRNTANGKLYVGSAVSIARRWTVHRSNLKTGVHRCKPLQRAYDKYGVAAFVYEVLEIVQDVANLIVREQHWLDTLDSHCDRGGYNVCPIAESRLGMKMPESAKATIGAKSRGKKLSDEHKAAISRVHKGKIISDAHRLAVSVAGKGRKQTPEWVEKRAAKRRGKPISDEHKRIVSATHKGKKLAQYQKDAVSRATKARWEAFRLARRPRGQLTLDF